MEVACPKCKARLKIPDEKIAPDGTRFKCPKCATILLVKKPAPRPQGLDKKKVLVAIADQKSSLETSMVLENAGFTVITSPDGVDSMVTAVRELPAVAILDVALPKIYGFEVCKRLKGREETKEMKVVLFTSVYDQSKYRRQPSSLYGADDYIESFDVKNSLLKKVQALVTGAPVPEAPAPVMKPQPPAAQPKPVPQAPQPAPVSDEWATKARRLARTVISDIFLYNPQKAEEALRNGSFINIFASEINEGRKLYSARIPKEVRDVMDYYADEMRVLLEDRKSKKS